MSNFQPTQNTTKVAESRSSAWQGPFALAVFVFIVDWILIEICADLQSAIRSTREFHSLWTGPLWIALPVIFIEWAFFLVFPTATVLWLVQRFFEQKRLILFQTPAGNKWLQMACGFCIGASAFLLFVSFAYLSRNYHIQGIKPHYPIARYFWVLLIIAVGVLAEEVLFRGYLLPALERKWGTLAALATSTTVFAAGHGHFGHGSLGEAFVHPVLHALALGAFLGSAFLVTRSLWLPIGLHFAWNCLGTVFFNSHTYGTASIFYYSDWPPAFELTGSAFRASVAICSLGAVILFRYAIRKNQMQRKSSLDIGV